MGIQIQYLALKNDDKDLKINILSKDFDGDQSNTNKCKIHGKKVSELTAQQREQIFGKEFVNKPNKNFKYQH